MWKSSVRGKIYMSCHCTMSDDLPLSRVHDVSTELEIRFKQAAPELFKVLIHPEPQTDNSEKSKMYRIHSKIAFRLLIRFAADCFL